MKKSAILLFVACLSACSPQTRLTRLISKHPELTVVDTLLVRDTLAIPAIEADTVLCTDSIHDTVFLTKGRLEVSIMKYHDTLYIRGKCKSDTLVITRNIPVVKVRFIKPDNASALIGKIPWLAAGFISLCLLIIILVYKFIR